MTAPASPLTRRSRSLTAPVRWTSSSSQATASHASSSSSSGGGPSATAVFYRALVPSMLHCLALGSIVYYALELVYMSLKREQQVERLGAQVARLELELETARHSSVSKAVPAQVGGPNASGKRWWKVW